MPRVEQVSRDTRVVGGKAPGLLLVQEAGLRVPEFEVSPEDLAATTRRLGFPLAVRSSASLEDGSRDSFAGQFNSYLNLRSIEAVHDAVASCHSSSQSDGVRAYCEQRGIDASQIKMDVIVQRMIQPSLAGVAFGVNPVTGDEQVVVEACAGLADHLLAGAEASLPDDHPLMTRHFPAIEDAVQRLQHFFGCPQDIEFAIEGDQLFVLQARPITSIRFAPSVGTWTNADFRDGGVSANVCSPLMSSLYQLIWDESLLTTLREIGLFVRDFEASRVFFGRLYWNLGEVKHCFERMPGYVEREFDTDLSVHIGYQGDGHRTPMNLLTIARALPVAWGIRKFFASQKSDAEHLLETTSGRIQERSTEVAGPLPQRATARLRSSAPAGRSRQQDNSKKPETPQTPADEGAFARLIERDYRHVERTYFRTVFAVSLAKLDFKMAFPDSDYVALVSGLPPLRHMEPQRRIEQLEHRGQRNVDAIADEFCHHCRWGVDVINPRWDEDREFVATLFDRHVPASTSGCCDSYERARREALASIPRRKRAEFQRKLTRLRHFVWLREELRDISNQMYYLVRRAALKLAEQRFLGDDIFFMSWREIVADDRSQIEKNRHTFECYRNYKPPNEIGGGGKNAVRLDSRRVQWRGIGVSGGTVTGVARVVMTVEQALQVDPGAILICPFTEPGWTPALGRVAGVVTETGGLLSHAAVICREYGLPAVLAVEGATETIRDGEAITVDGVRGFVERADTIT